MTPEEAAKSKSKADNEKKEFDASKIVELGKATHLGSIILRVKQDDTKPPYLEFSQLNYKNLWNNTYLSLHQAGKLFDAIDEMVQLITTDTIFAETDTGMFRTIKEFSLGSKVATATQRKGALPVIELKRTKRVTGGVEYHSIQFGVAELTAFKKQEESFRPHIPTSNDTKDVFEFTTQPRSQKSTKSTVAS